MGDGMMMMLTRFYYVNQVEVDDGTRELYL